MKKLLATAILAASLSVPAHAQQAGQGPLQGTQSPAQQGSTMQGTPQRPMMGGGPAWQQYGGAPPAGPAVRIDSATVREIQQSLDSRGFDPGMIDGIWGQRTSSSLRNFQSAQGLDPTGHPDLTTLSALGIDLGGGIGQQQSPQQDRSFRDLQPQEPLQQDQPWQSPSQSQREQPPSPGPAERESQQTPGLSPQSQNFNP